MVRASIPKALPMRHAVLAFVAPLLLVACGQANPVKSALKAPPPAPPPPTLSCAAPFLKAASAASLAQAFGGANVTEETVPGPEGSQNNATVIYAADATRRIEVLWANDAARTTLLYASIEQHAPDITTTVIGPLGLQIGDTVEEVEAINGGGFALTAFDQDNGGSVLDWKGGRIGREPCTVTVEFAPTNQTYSSVRGDTLFPSDSSAMRMARPTVARIGIGYPAAPAPVPPTAATDATAKDETP